MEDRTHYICRIRLDGTDAFVVWYSDARDGFVRKGGSSLLSAPTLQGILDAAAEIGIATASDSVTEYDFDHIEEWCSLP